MQCCQVNAYRYVAERINNFRSLLLGFLSINHAKVDLRELLFYHIKYKSFLHAATTFLQRYILLFTKAAASKSLFNLIISIFVEDFSRRQLVRPNSSVLSFAFAFAFFFSVLQLCDARFAPGRRVLLVSQCSGRPHALQEGRCRKDSDFIHLSARRTRLSLDSSLIIGASSRTGDVRLCCTTQQQRALRLLSATQSSILDESLKTSQANKLKINIAELSKNIRTYIRFCPPCLRNRTERHLPYGTLEPTQTPGFPFHIITIDLVTALPPETSGSDALMTVTSKHTKKVLLIPGMNDWSAAEWGASLVEGLIMHEWDLRHSIIKLTANLSAQTRQSKSPCDISLPREGLAAFCRDPTPRTSISSPGAIVERSRPRRRRTLVIVAGARSRLYQKALQKELVDDSSHSDSKMNEIRERIADLLWKNYCEATGRPL
ncbi:hypothetical protein HBI88_191660 [Parastagonospora nodorum]|nr:hypothetical protein HBI97_209480 [Parastagonospora nodorum]KAH5854914.1 hypothetical protein HBI90_186980 [Parastagonospora nodorum]KAH5910461.1 hypothetical protein HBI88_191660 [Parastagonospora nodorum]